MDSKFYSWYSDTSCAPKDEQKLDFLFKGFPLNRYIKFVLGILSKPSEIPSCHVPQKGLTIRGILVSLGNIARYLLAGIWISVFFVDIADSIINNEMQLGDLQRQQLVIVNMLAYLETQFTFWFTTSVTVTFIFMSSKIIRFLTSLVILLETLRGHRWTDGENVKKKHFAGLICVLAGLTVGRCIKGIINACTHLDPQIMVTYLYWTMTWREFQTVVNVIILIHRLAVFPLVLFVCFCCMLYYECCARQKTMVESLLLDPDVESSQIFLTRVRDLMAKETVLMGVLEELNDCFAPAVLLFLVNCTLALIAFAGQWYVVMPQTLLELVGFFLYPVSVGIMVLTILITCVVLEEKGRKVQEAWTGVATKRRNGPQTIEEGDLLEFILQRGTLRNYSILIGGFAPVTRPFVTTIAVAYTGFICFLLERVENTCKFEVA